MMIRLTRTLPAAILVLVVGLLARSVAVAEVYQYSPDDPIDVRILAAGNAVSDERRLELLRELQIQELPDDLRQDLAVLVTSIDNWVNSPLLWYYRRYENMLNLPIAESSRLYPILAFYQARGMVWRQIESAYIWNGGKWADRHDQFLAEIWHKFRIAHQAFPDNPIPAMYLGRALPSPQVVVADANAPTWAAVTREALERYNGIFEWWVDNRQSQNEPGMFRGGEDDDCEMWRPWSGILFGFDNPKLTRAEALLARCLLDQPFLAKGYSDRDLDVEHTSEPTTDTITPMLHLDPDDEQWPRRTLGLLDMMEQTWTGINQRGFLQFKSVYFNADKIDPDPAKASDTPWHVSAAVPMLLYWQRTADPRCTKLFSAWLDTWVDATARSDGGKPPGVIPASIHWPDGLTHNPGMPWWDPQCHPMENTLYQWPMALGNITQALVLGYYMTGDEKYIEPLRSMIRLRLTYLADPASAQDAEPGSAAWAAAQSIGGSCAMAAAKYRFTSGNTEFDDYLMVDGGKYLCYRLDPTEERFDQVVAALADDVDVLRYNFESHTSEARYTDRFFSDRFNKMLPPGSAMFGRSVDALLLYSVVTGDPGGNVKILPLNAVRWLTEPRDLGVFVTDTGADHFAAMLYSFQDQDRNIEAEFYLLNPGGYHAQLIADGQARQKYDLNVNERSVRLTFTLPPRTPCQLVIRPAAQP